MLLVAGTCAAEPGAAPLKRQPQPAVEDLSDKTIDIPPFYLWRRAYRLKAPSKAGLMRVGNDGRLTAVADASKLGDSILAQDQRRPQASSGFRPANDRFSVKLYPTQKEWMDSKASAAGKDADCFLDLTDTGSGETKKFSVGPCGYDGRAHREALGWHGSRNLFYWSHFIGSSSGGGSFAYQFDADHQAWTQINTEDADGFFLSPDGKWIVWEHGGLDAIHTVPLGGKQVHSMQIRAYDIEHNKNYRITNDVSFNSFAGWARP
ncbi:MAG: hypothetical protein HY077_03505 [Elusimicrobia bacterium]|nr:hypothetical protein [Elusimicrobiota bacterium]